ncbi:MAG: hypothetical protein Q8P81_03925 [Nanoarchaeota archaeon]|nr:hypothetical protein [Nanoarchaeota archaeon]
MAYLDKMNPEKLERVLEKLKAKAGRLQEQYDFPVKSSFRGDIVFNLITGLEGEIYLAKKDREFLSSDEDLMRRVRAFRNYLRFVENHSWFKEMESQGVAKEDKTHGALDYIEFWEFFIDGRYEADRGSYGGGMEGRE